MDTARLRNMRAWIIALSALLAAPAALAIERKPSLVVLTQSVTGTGSSLTTSLTGRYGTPSYGSDGLALDRLGRSIQNPAAVGSMPVRDYGTNRSQSALLAEAKTHVATFAPAVMSSMRSWMQANGVSSGFFHYKQQVSVSGTSSPMYLVWNAYTGLDGKAMYGDPKLVPEEPMLVQMTYVSKTVMSGLPQNWAYPDAGRMSWRLVDMYFQPKTGWQTVDTNGAFDEPQPGNDIAYDPDFGVKCLTDRTSNPACPAGYPDLKSLIDQNAAVGGILDYTRMVRPVYDQDPATGELIARTAISVDRRAVSYAMCAAALFVNDGRIGFTLQTTSDRYFVTPEAAISPVNTYTALSISPTQSYSYSIQPVGLDASSLSQLFIEPFSSPLALQNASASPWSGMVVYLAPITVEGSTISSLGVLNGATLYAEASCDAARPGQFLVRAIVPAAEQCHAGGCNSDYFWVERWFTVGVPAYMDPRSNLLYFPGATFSARNYKGQWWEPIGIAYDGDSTVYFYGFGTVTDGNTSCDRTMCTQVWYYTPPMPLDGSSRSYTYDTSPYFLVTSANGGD